MLKSSFIEILSTFDKAELLKFEDFIKSPYHNKNSNVIKLFTEIKKYSPVFDSAELIKETVWKKLYGEKAYNYGTMKNLIHEISKLGMKFIVLEEFEKNKLEKDVTLLTSLSSRNIAKLFSVKLNELERRYSMASFKEEDFHVNDFYSAYSKISWMKIFFYNTSIINSFTEKDILNGSAMFIYSFLIYLIKHYNNILAISYDLNFNTDKNLTAVFLKEISPDLIEKLLKIVKVNSERDYRILNVFRNMSDTFLNKENIEYYMKFKTSLIESIDIFSREDSKDLFICLSNSLLNLNTSKIDYGKERLEIMNAMIKGNIFSKPDGTVAFIDFQVYLWLAFYANEFNAIEKFSGKFIRKISTDNSEYAKKLCEALILFGKGSFDKVLSIISSTDYLDFMSKVNIKKLKVMCLYELNDYESFENENKSLYHFLKNNKSLSLTARNSINGLFDKINKLFKLKLDFNSYDYEKLLNEISNDSINKSSWLNKKISEFEKEH
jgi:6-pyruvoyl-tetrahydropterin synthase